MERRVIFRDGMDNDPADFNNLQDFVQGSLDDIVADGITTERKFAGFVVSQSGQTSISVAPGRLYSGGKVYLRPDAFARDFTTALPATARKVMLVVVYGSDGVETDARPREFLLNEETGESEPRVVTNELDRTCNINIVAGTEAPDPVDPVVDAGLLPIARIILTPTGVLTVTMIADNALASVKQVADAVGALQVDSDALRAKTVALDSNIASLTDRVTGTVKQDTFGRALLRLADIEAKVGIPSNAAASMADYFLTTDGSLLTDASSSCLLMEGIRFPDEAAASTALTLANPLNPLAKKVGDVLFPAYTRELRMNSGPSQLEIQASAYTYTDQELVQLTVSRSRIRYGDIFTVCTNAGWWGAIQNQYVPATFEHDGETFQNLGVDWDGPNHGWVRVQEYWVDTWDEPYWATQTVSHTIPGTQVAETFLVANDMVLDAVGLTFTRLAATGSVTIAICGTDRGQPDPTTVIAMATVDRSALLLNTETQIPLQPTYLTGGKRYAIVVITAADHYLAATQGVNFPQGTLFYILDGAYQQGDATKDICFSLYAAKFTQARSVIDLGQLQLAGGIAAIDILADTIAPGSTSLSYEVQIGGTWNPLGNDGSVLSNGGSLPPLLPFRAVFTGTPDVAPSVKLTTAVVKVSRAKLAFTHISATRTVASTTQVRVIEKLEHFDAAHNTSTVKLLTGTGYATSTSPNSFTDVAQADGGVIRTYVFNLGAAVTSYRIRSEGTTDAVQRPWHVGWRKDYSL